jgi:hypothetical protein
LGVVMEELLVLIFAGAVGAFMVKKRCDKCNAKWGRLAKCPVCARHICSSCGIKVRPIRSYNIDISDFEGTCCSEHCGEWDEDILRRRHAARKAHGVEVYSKNYRGSVPDVQFGMVIDTNTPVKDKDEAELRLKFLAAMAEAECITDFEFVRHTAQNGNYKYATWTAVGVI